MSEGYRCFGCGSDCDESALLMGKQAYVVSCACCGAELCPRCGHRRSLHVPRINRPLQDECEWSWDGGFVCGCSYYGADIDTEFKFAPVALGEHLGAPQSRQLDTGCLCECGAIAPRGWSRCAVCESRSRFPFGEEE